MIIALCLAYVCNYALHLFIPAIYCCLAALVCVVSLAYRGLLRVLHVRSRTLLVVLPAAAVILGLTCWCTVPEGIGTALALPVAPGLALASALHLATDARGVA